MVFEEISYATLFGLPVILWLGIIILILLLAVASIGYLLNRGNKKVKFSWHKYFALIFS